MIVYRNMSPWHMQMDGQTLT